MSRSSGCESASPRRQRSFSKSYTACWYWRMLRPCAGKARGDSARRRRVRAHVGIALGVLEVLDGAAAADLVDVGGDAQQHPPDAIEVDHDVAAVGMIGVRAQVDHRRVLAELELLKPAGAVAQPLDVIAQPLGDQLAAGRSSSRLPSGPPAPASRTASAARPGAASRPSRSASRTSRGPAWAEPGRRGDLADQHALGVCAGDRPRPLELSHLPPPRPATHAPQQPRLAWPRPAPCLAANRLARHVERIAPLPDGLFAKLNALALFSAPLLPGQSDKRRAGGYSAETP